MKATARVNASMPPPPAPVVAFQGAAVVEFFGVPLEGVQDVVFVLDSSGSMEELAQGRAAQIQVVNNPPPPVSGSAAVQPAEAVGTNPPPPGTDTGPPPPGTDTSPPPPGTEPPPVSGDTHPATPAYKQPRKIEVAQSELVDALQRLPAGTRMNVVFFNSDLEAFAPGMVPLEEVARAGLVEFVKETVPTGSTALAPAMRSAFLMNARRIVLLSDGLGNVGGNAQAVLRDAREAIRGGVRIDTIGLGRDQDARLLEALARESGGLYQAL